MGSNLTVDIIAEILFLFSFDLFFIIYFFYIYEFYYFRLYYSLSFFIFSSLGMLYKDEEDNKNKDNLDKDEDFVYKDNFKKIKINLKIIGIKEKQI